MEEFTMSNIKTAAEAMQRLEELKLEITGKKPDPTAEAKKQAAAYSTAFWDTCTPVCLPIL